MTAVAAPHPANNARLLPSVGVLTGRALRIHRRTPQLLILRIVQSVAFLLIFRYVFGGAIGTGAMRYVDFMAPGLLTVGIMFAICTVLLMMYQLNKRTTIDMAEELAARRAKAASA